MKPLLRSLDAAILAFPLHALPQLLLHRIRRLLQRRRRREKREGILDLNVDLTIKLRARTAHSHEAEGGGNARLDHLRVLLHNELDMDGLAAFEAREFLVDLAAHLGVFGRDVFRCEADMLVLAANVEYIFVVSDAFEGKGPGDWSLVAHA